MTFIAATLISVFAANSAASFSLIGCLEVTTLSLVLPLLLALLLLFLLLCVGGFEFFRRPGCAAKASKK